jgi:hypothetical protein
MSSISNYVLYSFENLYIYFIPQIIIKALYRVIHRSLRDFRRLRNSCREGHAEGVHVSRGRDTPSFCPTLQVLDSSFLLCLSWLLRSRFRKFLRDLRITLYTYMCVSKFFLQAACLSNLLFPFIRIEPRKC